MGNDVDRANQSNKPMHWIQFPGVPVRYGCIDDGQILGGHPRVLLCEELVIPWHGRKWKAGSRLMVHPKYLHIEKERRQI